MAASRGGESCNGGHGPGERGWGRSALRGVGGGLAVWQPARRSAGADPVRRPGSRQPFLVAEGDCARSGEQQVLLGGPTCEARGPGGPPLRAAQGPEGRDPAPPVRTRRRG